MTSSLSILSRAQWRLKLLVFLNCCAALLLFSLFNPYTMQGWNRIDHFVFTFLNQSLEKQPYLHILWAAANHSLADWFEDLCIFIFYAVAIWKTQKGHRIKTAAGLLFCVFLIAATILCINRFLCRDILHLRRSSPSRVVPTAIHLSDFLSWLPSKSDSAKSFPGDHATTALMFALSYAYLIRGRLAILALIYGSFLCLPRLIVGAHWLSDIVVGTGCILLFSLSWAFCSPLASKSIHFLEQGIEKLCAKKIKIR